MSCRLLVLLLLAFFVGSSVAGDVTYVFGVNLALDAATAGQNYQMQVDCLQGYSIWRDWWNELPASQRTTAWGDTFKVELHVEMFSDYSSAGPTQMAQLYEAYSNMSHNSSINYFFGTAGFQGMSVRSYCLNELGIPIQVFPLDSSQAFYEMPGSFSSVTANELRMVSILPYLRMNKGKSVALLQVNDGGYQNEMCGGVALQAAAQGIEVVAYYENMPIDWTTFGEIVGVDNRSAIWEAALDDVISKNPDAVLVCDYTYGAAFSLDYFRKVGWTPNMMVISPIWTWPSYADPTLLDYVITITPYSPAAHYSAQFNFTDSPGYDDMVMARYGVHAGEYQAVATLAGMMWSEALVNSPSNSTADLLQTMRLSQINSFMGLVAMDVHNAQTIPCLIVQFTDSGNTSSVVGPPLAAAKSIVYPMPSWEQRTFSSKWGSGVEIAGLIFIILGILIALGWGIFLFAHRNHPVMLAASPVFCYGMIFGSLLVYVSIFTWMPNLITEGMCSARSWILPVGFIVMFASMLAKTERVCRIYYAFFDSQNIKKQAIRISNLQVFLIVLAMVIVQMILSVLMVSVSPAQAVIHVIDEYRVSENFWVCTFPKPLVILFGISVGYAGALLIWGTYLAWRVRKVPLSSYDESKVIGFSIYNTAFFGIIVIVIQLAIGNSNRNLTFMITAICCFLGATITISTLFSSKWFAIYRPGSFYSSTSTPGMAMSVYRKEGNHTHTSNSASGDGTTREARSKNKSAKSKSNDGHDSLKDLRQENEDLKAKITSMQVEIDELKKATETRKKHKRRAPKEESE